MFPLALEVMVPRAPPVKLTSSSSKSLMPSENVKVMIAVSPISKVAWDEVISSVGASAWRVAVTAVAAVLSFPAVSCAMFSGTATVTSPLPSGVMRTV